MLNQLKRRALQFGFDRYYAWRISEFYEHQVIEVDYPVDPSPRYLPATGPHPILWHWFDRQRAACVETLQAMAAYRARFEAIPTESVGADSPHWKQPWFSALDAMTSYMLIASRRPSRIVEIGSGNSTRFAAAAIADHGLGTTLTSIDPHPRADIDVLCDEVIRAPLERVDQRVFRELRAGDFLFVDSSHRTFTNSDVTTLFFEVLPTLPAGALVHVHDVFLPWDYPTQWRHRYYSEQYLLGCWLLSGPERLRLIQSNVFVSWDDELRKMMTELFAASSLSWMCAPDYAYGSLRGVSGTSFWAEVAGSNG